MVHCTICNGALKAGQWIAVSPSRMAVMHRQCYDSVSTTTPSRHFLSGGGGGDGKFTVPLVLVVGIMGLLLWFSDEYDKESRKRVDACESKVKELEQKIIDLQPGDSEEVQGDSNVNAMELDA